jgi:hypothetical protein
VLTSFGCRRRLLPPRIHRTAGLTGGRTVSPALKRPQAMASALPFAIQEMEHRLEAEDIAIQTKTEDDAI